MIPATLRVLAYLQRTLFLPRPAYGRAFGRLADRSSKTSSPSKLFERGAVVLAGWATEAFFCSSCSAVSASVQALPVFPTCNAHSKSPMCYHGQTDAYPCIPEQLTSLGFARHFRFDATIRVGTSFRHPAPPYAVDRDFAIQVVAFTLENRVLFNLNLNVQIASRCAISPASPSPARRMRSPVSTLPGF